MKGEVDTNLMTTQEAQYLANMWQLYLLDDSKYRLMQHFNLSPQTFNYADVVSDMAKLPQQASNDQSKLN